MNERELNALCGKAAKSLTGRNLTVRLGDFEGKSYGNVISMPVCTSGSDFLREFLKKLVGSEQVDAWLCFAEEHAFQYSGDWLTRRLKALASYIPRKESEVERWKAEQERQHAEWQAMWKGNRK